MRSLTKGYLFILILLSLEACKKSYRVLEPGVYLIEKSEGYQVNVFEKRDSLFIKMGRDLHYVHEKKSRSYIKMEDREIKTWMDGDTLKVFKSKYIPLKQTLTYKFTGVWYSEEKDLIIESNLLKDSFWTLTKNGIPNNTYLPKKTENGFAITLNNEIVEFILEGNCLKDSEGYLYCKN